MRTSLNNSKLLHALNLRKQAEELLLASEMKLRQVIDGLGPDTFVGLTTLDGMLIEANRPALAAAGLTPEDVLGKPFAEAYWWAYSETVQAQLRTAIAHAAAGKSSRYDVQIRVAEATLSWIDFSLNPVHDASGEVIYLVPSANVIEERKQAEDASERALHHLSEAQRIGRIGDWDFELATGSITWSPQMFEILGRDPGPGPPENFDEAAHLYEPTSALRMSEKIAGAIASGEPQEYELIALRPDGQRITIHAITVPRKDAIGKVVALYGTIQDISERSLAEKSLREAKESMRQLNAQLEQRVIERTTQLEAANKELEAFSYSVSHDLRAPLRAVNGFAQIVLDSYGPQMPAEAREYLEDIRAGGEQMGRLIDDLLALARLGRQAMKSQPVETELLVQDALEVLAPQREGRPIEINVGLLPGCQGDEALLKQVWLNLVSNAIKYTCGRTPAVIEIGCEQVSAEDVFFVRDNGAGFDMRYAHKMFGVFQRLHRADEFEGTGVGLAIVQRIINRHGGRVWAEGEVGRGASLYFTLKEKEKR